MLKDNTEKKKLSRDEKKKWVVRIVAMVMAVLMILGLGVTAISIILGSRAKAAEPVSVIDTSSLKQSGDVLISVGLSYGSDVSPAATYTSDEGFDVGWQQMNGERRFESLWTLYEEKVTVACDDNLSYSGDSFSIASSERRTDIGAYHLEINCWGYDRDDLEELIGVNRRAALREGLILIPAYINGSYAVRVGSFRSRDEAEDVQSVVEDLFPEHRVSVVSPTSTGVQIVSADTAEILFEFDCGGEVELGLTAREDRNGNTYIHASSGYFYDGVFAFKRSVSGDSDGLMIVNILPIETYVAGVLPYETSNSWPEETMKAFAITVRSFTLTYCGENGKHRNKGFDLCPEVCCQVYRGAGRTNEAVMNAVLGTAGDVLTYHGDIVTAYYSSSVGGVTVNAEDAWEGTKPVPYLKAVETPWEKYMEHENAFWITEVSPSALLDRFRQAGCTNLRGEVESVEIVELAKNSTYIKTLRVTDSYGNEALINTTDGVRTSLTPYVKSANFVVGKGKVAYTEDIVLDAAGTSSAPGKSSVPVPEKEPEPEGPLGIEYSFTDLDEYVVITSESLEKSYFKNSVLLANGDGYTDYFRSEIFAITAENASAFLGEAYDEQYRNDDLIPKRRTETAQREEQEQTAQDSSSGGGNSSGTDTVYKIAYADDSDNFIFVGKGWGHGVGMSQWGAFDLAVRGYTAKQILDAYFYDVDILNYLETNQY
ncbi:MAG: SpoIID/LytB domain-containing protein [Ruminococcaceae bacterium]|nr:SpoIID/LytB domain-containing protein [Oscillospiraceae bacterium]